MDKLASFVAGVVFLMFGVLACLLPRSCSETVTVCGDPAEVAIEDRQRIVEVCASGLPMDDKSYLVARLAREWNAAERSRRSAEADRLARSGGAAALARVSALARGAP